MSKYVQNFDKKIENNQHNYINNTNTNNEKRQYYIKKVKILAIYVIILSKK